MTSRLYNPPEPKFKYVPKTKEKEIKTISRNKIYRDRGDPKLRHSPVKVLRDMERSKSESPQRMHSKRSNVSPVKEIEPKKRAARVPGKPLTHDKSKKDSSHSDKKSEDSRGTDTHSRNGTRKPDTTKGRDTHGGQDLGDVSAAARKKGTKSPDRLKPLGSGRLGTGRHMTSASSLANVPESITELDEPVSPRKQETDTSNYVVKKRAKKGRASFLDDGFRCHSAPDSQSMAEAFDEYSEQMEMSQGKEIEPPEFKTSLSVDDSGLNKQSEPTEQINEMNNGSYNLTASVPDEESMLYEQIISSDKQDEEYMNESETSAENPQPTNKETDVLEVNMKENALDRKRPSISNEGEESEDVPLKKSKQDSELSKSLTEGMNMQPSGKSVRKRSSNDEMFSDDSLDSDISVDSLDDSAHKRLTQSLPPSFFASDKPMSSDSLSENEDSEDSFKVQKNRSHSKEKLKNLSRSKTMCHDIDSKAAEKSRQMDLKPVTLEQINITDSKDKCETFIDSRNSDSGEEKIEVEVNVPINSAGSVTAAGSNEFQSYTNLNNAQIHKLTVNAQQCIDIIGEPVQLESASQEVCQVPENQVELKMEEVKTFISEIVNNVKDKLNSENEKLSKELAEDLGKTIDVLGNTDNGILETSSSVHEGSQQVGDNQFQSVENTKEQIDCEGKLYTGNEENEGFDRSKPLNNQQGTHHSKTLSEVSMIPTLNDTQDDTVDGKGNEGHREGQPYDPFEVKAYVSEIISGAKDIIDSDQETQPLEQESRLNAEELSEQCSDNRTLSNEADEKDKFGNEISAATGKSQSPIPEHHSQRDPVDTDDEKHRNKSVVTDENDNVIDPHFVRMMDEDLHEVAVSGDDSQENSDSNMVTENLDNDIENDSLGDTDNNEITTNQIDFTPVTIQNDSLNVVAENVANEMMDERLQNVSSNKDIENPENAKVNEDMTILVGKRDTESSNNFMENVTEMCKTDAGFPDQSDQNVESHNRPTSYGDQELVQEPYSNVVSITVANEMITDNHFAHAKPDSQGMVPDSNTSLKDPVEDDINTDFKETSSSELADDGVYVDNGANNMERDRIDSVVENVCTTENMHSAENGTDKDGDNEKKTPENALDSTESQNIDSGVKSEDETTKSKENTDEINSQAITDTEPYQASKSSQVKKTCEVGVGTSTEMLFDGSQDSGDSYTNTEEEREILQDMLEKLPAR